MTKAARQRVIVFPHLAAESAEATISMVTSNASVFAVNIAPMAALPSTNVALNADTNNIINATATHSTVTPMIPANTNLPNASDDNTSLTLAAIINFPGMTPERSGGRSRTKTPSTKSPQEKTEKQQETIIVARAHKDTFMNCSANQLMRCVTIYLCAYMHTCLDTT